MKSFLKKFKHTLALFAVCLLAFAVHQLGAPIAASFWIVALWQLSQIAMSKHRPGVFHITTLSDAQSREFTSLLEQLKDEVPNLAANSEKIGKLEKLFDQLYSETNGLRRAVAKFGQIGGQIGVKVENGIPRVSDDCAKYLGSMFVIKAVQDNKLKGSMADELLQKATAYLQMEAKAAVASTDIPLPTSYGTQIVELVYIYGTARKNCTVYPLSGSSMKLPRLKTGEPTFGFINSSSNVPEKVPQSEWVTFTPGKGGGIVRIPSEIDADSIFSIGQFVARYIAREMALLEDTCLFLGDGSATYNSIKGVGAQATADGGNAIQVLAAGKTKPSDITLANLRSLRGSVTGAVLGTAKYYMHPSMEALLVSFNTSATVVPYQRKADGSATLDGFPIVWVPVMPVYQLAANASAYQVYFGDLSWWYFGERSILDVMTSRDVYFATDEIGIRALERFDIHQMGQASTGALQLAAA